MAKIKLNNLSNSDIFHTGRINDIHRALNVDVVGRDSTYGAPVPDQNLGTAIYQWDECRIKNLYENNIEITPDSLIAGQNDLVSGKSRSLSNQAQFLDPAGSGGGRSVTLEAATTNLVFKVNGQLFTLAQDINITALEAAPSSNNTCLVNDLDATGAWEQARTYGEINGTKTYITVDNMGSEITALIGTYQAFKVGTEYFIGFIASSTELNKCYRGFFYDSSGNPFKRIKLNNNDTITLMKLAWLFLENNLSTVDASYTNPVWSYTQPASPVADDYWYDLANETWKRYDGSSFNVINRTFIGWAICDTTDCLGARCRQFFANKKREQTIHLEIDSGTIIKGSFPKDRSQIENVSLERNLSEIEWDTSSNFAASSDTYNSSLASMDRGFLYLSNDGNPYISDFEPYKIPNTFGLYHPHHTWRCVGVFGSPASSFEWLKQFTGNEDDSKVPQCHFVGNSPQWITAWNALYVMQSFTSSLYYGDILMYRNTSSPWDFRFLQPGIYQMFYRGSFDVGYDLSDTTWYTDTIEMRLYNHSKGVAHWTSDQSLILQVPYPTQSDRHRDSSAWIGTFKIENISHVYGFQGRIVNGTLWNNIINWASPGIDLLIEKLE